MLKIFKKQLGDVSPMILFLDGEEAFVKWDKTDSIYGARNLAKKLASQAHISSDLASKSLTMLDSLVYVCFYVYFWISYYSYVFKFVVCIF